MENVELQYCWMLHEIAKSLGMAENLQAILNLIVKSVVDNLGLKASSIRLLDKDKKTLKLEAAYGLSDEYLRKGPVEIDKSPIDKEALKGKPVVIKEVDKDSRMLQYPDEARKEGIASMVCIPLMIKDEVIGSLRGYSSKTREFSSVELTFLTALGNLGAIAIENARLNERLIKKAEVMKKLLNIAEAVTSTLNKKEVLERVIKAAIEVLNAKGCSLRLMDENKERLELVSSIGLSPQYLAKGAIRVSEEIKDVIEGKPAVIYNALVDERVYDKESLKREGIKSILAVPIIVKNKIIGVLKVYDQNYRKYEDDEVEALNLLASIGGIAIEKARKFFEILEGNVDSIIGVPSDKIISTLKRLIS
ncbi:MAG: GAF domain-containing protein [Candidatus Bathyarchaeia archaeon]